MSNVPAMNYIVNHQCPAISASLTQKVGRNVIDQQSGTIDHVLSPPESLGLSPGGAYSGTRALPHA
jgi:hypothetical protein